MYCIGCLLRSLSTLRRTRGRRIDSEPLLPGEERVVRLRERFADADLDTQAVVAAPAPRARPLSRRRAEISRDRGARHRLESVTRKAVPCKRFARGRPGRPGRV